MMITQRMQLCAFVLVTVVLQGKLINSIPRCKKMGESKMEEIDHCRCNVQLRSINYYCQEWVRDVLFGSLLARVTAKVDY